MRTSLLSVRSRALLGRSVCLWQPQLCPSGHGVSTPGADLASPLCSTSPSSAPELGQCHKISAAASLQLEELRLGWGRAGGNGPEGAGSRAHGAETTHMGRASSLGGGQHEH